MIVVTSTAKNAPVEAFDCVASVKSAAARVTQRVQHVFYAADDATAFAIAGLGPRVIRSDAPQLQNLIEAWLECDPADIVVHLDGDDTLTPRALERVARMYADPDVWLTYGSFVRSDGVPDRTWHAPFGHRYAPGVDPRKDAWRASHLKTFRAGLVQHLIYNHGGYLRRWLDGALFEECLDLAVMFPLLDLAGERYAVSREANVIYRYDPIVHERETPGAYVDRHDLRSRARIAPLVARPW